MKNGKVTLPLLLIVIFSAAYRALLVFRSGFPPGADIGLHSSIIHSITLDGNTNFIYNYYHMGGGSSNTFPGFHIFVSALMLQTGLPDYLAQAFVAIAFSTLLVLVAFLLTRSILNESVALIVAFFMAFSYYDVYILLWSGYPNILTLTLIPLTLYVLLEKARFSPLTWIAVGSLLSAAIFLTHSLSTVMFAVIVLTAAFLGVCFSNRLGVSRKSVLEWLSPLVVGGLLVSPFLVAVAPVYLNFNSAVYTGGAPDIQPLLLQYRLMPAQYVLLFAAGVFLCLALLRFMPKKRRFAAVLLTGWLTISTVLTQSYVFGFYLDYERFLYFATLPLAIVVGAGIFVSGRFLAGGTSQFLPLVIERLQKRYSWAKSQRHFSPHAAMKVVTVILILAALFALPNFSMTPDRGLQMQTQQQVMTQPGYDTIEWIKNNTAPNAVFVADALYGWWLSGSTQRQTISAINPVFITNSREFQPALLATRLLDTDYLIDNGLIQVREDGGYVGSHNPQFLAKLNNSYYRYPFLNFNNSQTSITFSIGGEVKTVKLSELPVQEMNMKTSPTSATVVVSKGNDLFNFTQKTTVYQGVRFVNITQTLSSANPAVSFDTVSLAVQSKGEITERNATSVTLEDPYMNVAGQMIFEENQPNASQAQSGKLELHFNLKGHKPSITVHVSVFEYPVLRDAPATQMELQKLYTENLNGYANKVAEVPMNVFDYKQAIAELNVTYFVIRDTAQIPRFSNDPAFSQVFSNSEVTIFQIHRPN